MPHRLFFKKASTLRSYEKEKRMLRKQNKLLRTLLISFFIKMPGCDWIESKSKAWSEADDCSEGYAVLAFNFFKTDCLYVKILEELLREHCTTYILEAYKFYICCVKTGVNALLREELTKQLWQWHQIIASKIKNDFIIASSNTYTALLSLKEACHEALLAMEFHARKSCTGIVLYEEIQQFLKASCCEAFEKVYGVNNDYIKLKDKVIKYIEDNYSNNRLCLTSIADYLNMNPYYLSRLFKAQSGLGISQFINAYRVKKAKEIMKAIEISQREVAETVGYTNTKTFRRAFMKHEGMNPGKLKKTGYNSNNYMQ